MEENSRPVVAERSEGTVVLGWKGVYVVTPWILHNNAKHEVSRYPRQ